MNNKVHLIQGRPGAGSCPPGLANAGVHPGMNYRFTDSRHVWLNAKETTMFRSASAMGFALAEPGQAPVKLDLSPAA